MILVAPAWASAARQPWRLWPVAGWWLMNCMSPRWRWIRCSGAAVWERGCAQHATLEVAAGNIAAQALYAAAGFRTAGIRRAYYRNGDDALIQWLRLHDGVGVRITDHF
jgi:hypothetical protein